MGTAFLLLQIAALSADPVTVDYVREVHPILAERCYTCHGKGADKGGLQIDKHDLLLEGGDSGPAIIPGDPDGSLLIRLVSGQDPGRVMPPKGDRLSETQIDILRAWIAQGAKWGEARPLSAPEHPLQLREVAPPRESANPVDAFIAAYGEAVGLTPPAPISDGAFLRRAKLDLQGLLPVPGATRVFAQSSLPDKDARAIDSFLADDDAYAAHWISFWNDLLRNDYTGTGYIDGGREQITPWLYRALENNLPYNEFVARLITEAPGAQGFVKGIVWRGETAAVQRPPMQAAKNVAQVFLGVNLKCAACHDSFVDHWTLKNAYGMASLFADAPLELVRCDVPQGETPPAEFLWPELGSIDPALSRADRLARTAELVTSPENGPFARAIVNRLWAHFYGRGLVEPVDNIEAKSWYPELLDWLARDFIASGYDLKHTMRLMTTAQAYRWPAVPAVKEARDDSFVFRGPQPKRLSAEQFYDALGTLAGAWQSAEPKFVPRDAQARTVRAWQVPADPLMRALDRPNREMVVTRRESIATTLQLLELNNGETLNTILQRAAESLVEKMGDEPQRLAEYVFLAALQRTPSAEESALASEALGAPATKETTADLLWAVLLQPEFQFVF